MVKYKIKIADENSDIFKEVFKISEVLIAQMFSIDLNPFFKFKASIIKMVPRNSNTLTVKVSAFKPSN